MRSLLWLLIIIVLIAIVIWWLMRRSKQDSGAGMPAAPRLPEAMPKPTIPTAAMDVKTPRVDMPRVDMPRVDMPRVDMPRVEMPQVEMPQVEMPQVEMPQVEMPSAAAPLLAGGIASGGVDDLTIVEGIGPKVAALLKDAGISTFSQLANTDVGYLEQLLRDAGLRMMNPATWPEQARLASVADHEGLQRLQEQLKGGRRA